MPPTLHCVRHAQGYHNLGVDFHNLPDPKLTPLGEEQCLILRSKHFPDQSKLSLIVASPLTRTLHTAYIAFEPALQNQIAYPRILGLPDAQETSTLPADTGSDLDKLNSICSEQGWPVDLTLLTEGWNIKTLENRYAPTSDAIKARASDARRFIRAKMQDLVATGFSNPEIVLVAHGGYLHYFTDDWEGSDKNMGTGWENCETRAYTFEQGVNNDDEEAHIVETAESRKQRGLNTPRYSRQDQKMLFDLTMKSWESQGLGNASTFGRQEEIRSSGNVGLQSDEDATLTRTASNHVQVIA